jgi:hypothetical protein
MTSPGAVESGTQAYSQDDESIRTLRRTIPLRCRVHAARSIERCIRAWQANWKATSLLQAALEKPHPPGLREFDNARTGWESLDAGNDGTRPAEGDDIGVVE